MDEAGRGPLAGPVVAAAVVISRTFLESEESGLLASLTDSKQLSGDERDRFYGLITSPGVAEVGVGRADAREVDEINILRATHAAMIRSLRGLAVLPEHVMVDGLPVPGLPCSSTAIIKGDGKSLLIAAASVVAKVVRDRMMEALDREFPQYGFARHKGYGTAEHIGALFKHGPCPEHRMSFRPVREACEIRTRAANTDEYKALDLDLFPGLEGGRRG